MIFTKTNVTRASSFAKRHVAASFGRIAILLAACTLSCAAHSFLDDDGGSTPLIPGDSGGGGGGGGAGGSPQNPIGVSFEAVAPASAARKVKSLLTGQVLTAAEREQITVDSNSLATLVDAWMQSEAYAGTLLRFFGVAFQQSSTYSSNFTFNMYSRAGYGLSPTLEPAVRESFGRTMVALVQQNEPFNAALTTNRYMMTTELAAFYLYTETSRMADDLVYRTNRWWNDDHVPKWSLRRAGGPLSTKVSADPTNPLYLTFYAPKLGQSFAINVGGDCASLDPMDFTSAHTFAFGEQWGDNVWALMNSGGGFVYADQSVPGAVKCQSYETGMEWFKASDYNDWRMVTVRRPGSNERLTEMFDLETLREGNTILVNSERLGFFTTPAFLSQWSTNISNSARALANQVMIVALGEQVDGADRLPLTSPSAVDPKHSAEPACYACHETLDPLRQFFRQSMTLTGSPQGDASQKQIPATMSFRGQVVSGTGVTDLAQALAAHPLFAKAWTVKVCSWVNSSPCAADDPEIVRIADNFARSNFNFNQMMREVLLSPVTTYLAPSVSSQAVAPHISMARRTQFCANLSARLGVPDICQLSTNRAAGQDTIPDRSAVVPADSYARGQNHDQWVVQPDPFYVANVENICALAGQRVVDQASAGGVTFSSGSPDTSVPKMVETVMGLDPVAAAPAVELLRAHFDAAKAGRTSANIAMRSTFVVACSSAMMTTMGQ